MKNNEKTMKKLLKIIYFIFIYTNMVLYTCELCNLSTKLYGNYKQHLKTKKHGRNVELSKNKEGNMVKSQKRAEKSQKEPEKSQKEPKRASKKNKYLSPLW